MAAVEKPKKTTPKAKLAAAAKPKAAAVAKPKAAPAKAMSISGKTA